MSLLIKILESKKQAQHFEQKYNIGWGCQHPTNRLIIDLSCK